MKTAALCTENLSNLVFKSG